jgi:hypothetical protein
MRTYRRVLLVLCALVVLGGCGYGENIPGQGPTERPDYLDKAGAPRDRTQ